MVLIALVSLVVWWVRRRREPAPAPQRLAEAAKHLGSSSVALGDRAAHRVGSGLAEVPAAVGGAAHEVHRFWRKWTLRILMLLAATLGYTAGAAAGRERYEQIVGLSQAATRRARQHL